MKKDSKSQIETDFFFENINSENYIYRFHSFFFKKKSFYTSGFSVFSPLSTTFELSPSAQQPLYVCEWLERGTPVLVSPPSSQQLKPPHII